MLMNLLGIFNFTANYLPWVLLLFPIIFSGALPYGDLIGIFAGFLYEAVSRSQHPALIKFRGFVLRVTRR
jgi:Der1-like family protein